jgi:hypothetical protein
MVIHLPAFFSPLSLKSITDIAGAIRAWLAGETPALIDSSELIVSHAPASIKGAVLRTDVRGTQHGPSERSVRVVFHVPIVDVGTLMKESEFVLKGLGGLLRVMGLPHRLAGGEHHRFPGNMELKPHQEGNASFVLVEISFHPLKIDA